MNQIESDCIAVCADFFFHTRGPQFKDIVIIDISLTRAWSIIFGHVLIFFSCWHEFVVVVAAAVVVVVVVVVVVCCCCFIVKMVKGMILSVGEKKNRHIDRWR